MASAGEVSRLANALYSLQKQYLHLVENEDPECDSAFNYYNELSEELKKKCEASMKYSNMLVQNPHYQEAFQAGNASLMIPMIKILHAGITAHKTLSKVFLDEGSSTSNMIQVLFLHSSWAADSLLIAERGLTGESPEEEAPFESDHAKTIIELSTDVSEKLVKNEGERMIRFILDVCPHAPDILSKCSGFSSRRSVTKLAMVFINAAEDLLEEERRNRAIELFQASWKMILQRRKWMKMKKGFILLQRLLRRKRRKQEESIGSNLLMSEKKFENELATMIAQREMIEEKFKRIMATASCSKVGIKKFEVMDVNRGSNIRPNTSSENFLQSNMDRREAAALVLQAVVRKWLVKKQNRRPLWSKALMANNLTETKVRRYREEIEFWQQKHQVPAMSQNDLQELQQKTQLAYATFAKGVKKGRLQEHKAMVKVSQSHTILSMLETAPKLRDYHPIHRSQFHSLPLHIATKARLEHKEAMKKMDQPAWKKTLQEFG